MKTENIVWICGSAAFVAGVLATVFLFDYAGMRAVTHYNDGYQAAYAKGKADGVKQALSDEAQEAYCASLWFSSGAARKEK